MNDVFDKFRKKIWGRLLTIVDASASDYDQREALKSLMRKAINESLADFEKDLRGED